MNLGKPCSVRLTEGLGVARSRVHERLFAAKRFRVLKKQCGGIYLRCDQIEHLLLRAGALFQFIVL